MAYRYFNLNMINQTIKKVLVDAMSSCSFYESLAWLTFSKSGGGPSQIKRPLHSYFCNLCKKLCNYLTSKKFHNFYEYKIKIAENILQTNVLK